MKKSLLLFIACCFLISACKKEDSTTSIDPNVDIKSSIITGKWTIASFRELTEDKTSAYSDLLFAFNADGTVNATKKDKVINGTWSYSPATSSYYGSPSTTASFTLTMNGSGDIQKLNRSWDVNSKTTLTDLQLDDKQPLEDRHLEFVK